MGKPNTTNPSENSFNQTAAPSSKLESLHTAIEQNQVFNLGIIEESLKNQLLSHRKSYGAKGLTVIELAASSKKWDYVVQVAENITLSDDDANDDRYGCAEALKLAIEAGQPEAIYAILNIKNNKFDDLLHKKYGKNCLHIAIDANRSVKDLVSFHNVSLTVTKKCEDKSGEKFELTPLEYAFYMHKEECFSSATSVRRFKEHADQRTFYHAAAEHNRLDHLTRLFKTNLNPNIQDGEGLYPLEIAFKHGNKKCFQFLLEKADAKTCREIFLKSETSSSLKKMLIKRLQNLSYVLSEEAEAKQTLADIYRMKKAPGWYIFTSQETKARNLYAQLADKYRSQYVFGESSLIATLEYAFLDMAGSNSATSGLAAEFINKHVNNSKSPIHCEALIYSAIVWNKKGDFEKAKSINSMLAATTSRHAKELMDSKTLLVDQRIVSDITQLSNTLNSPKFDEVKSQLGNRCLLDAVQAGNAKDVEELLGILQKTKYFVPFFIGDKTPIEIAAQNNRWDLVEMLTNTNEWAGKTPTKYINYDNLLLAALNTKNLDESRIKAARALLNAGASFNATTPENLNGLHFIIHNHIKDSKTKDLKNLFLHALVKARPKHYVQIGTFNKEMVSPLELAVSSNKWDFVKFMAEFERGTTADLFNGYGKALTSAIKYGQHDAAQQLISTGASSSFCIDKLSAFDWAIKNHTADNDNTVMFDLFVLAPKRFLSELNYFGQTPLEYAVAEKKWDLVNRFSEKFNLGSLSPIIMEKVIHQTLIDNQQDTANQLLSNYLKNNKNYSESKIINHLYQQAIINNHSNILSHLISSGKVLGENEPLIKLAIECEAWECSQILDPLASRYNEFDEYLLHKLINVTPLYTDSHATKEYRIFIFNKLEERANKEIPSAQMALAQVYRLGLAPKSFWFSSQEAKAEKLFAKLYDGKIIDSNKLPVITDLRYAVEIKKLLADAFEAIIDKNSTVQAEEAIFLIKKLASHKNPFIRKIAMVYQAIIWGDKKLLERVEREDFSLTQEIYQSAVSLITKREALLKAEMKVHLINAIKPTAPTGAPELSPPYPAGIQDVTPPVEPYFPLPSAPQLPPPSYGSAHQLMASGMPVASAPPVQPPSYDSVHYNALSQASAPVVLPTVPTPPNTPQIKPPAYEEKKNGTYIELQEMLQTKTASAEKLAKLPDCETTPELPIQQTAESFGPVFTPSCAKLDDLLNAIDKIILEIPEFQHQYGIANNNAEIIKEKGIKNLTFYEGILLINTNDAVTISRNNWSSHIDKLNGLYKIASEELERIGTKLPNQDSYQSKLNDIAKLHKNYCDEFNTKFGFVEEEAKHSEKTTRTPVAQIGK